MSRAELARLAEVPYPTLAGLENGDQNASTKLHAIAKVLRVRPEWLETGKGAREEAALLQHSHSVRLDPEIVRSVARALRKVYKEAGRVYVLEDEPERFAWLYELGVAAGDAAPPENMVRLLIKQDQAQQGAPTDERSIGVPTHSKTKRGNGGRRAKA